MVFGSGATGGNMIGTGIVVSLYDAFTQNSDKISKSFQTLESAAENASLRIDTAFNKMKLGFGVAAVGSMIAAPFILASKGAMAFEEGMAKINTTAQLGQKELSGLRNELLSIGSSGTSDIMKIPDAYEKIISQTNDVKLSLDILKTANKGAMAGFTDVDVVAGALAQTLSIVGKQNTNAAEVMDTLFAAKRVGAGEFKDFANYLPQLIAAGSNLGYTFKETAGIFAYFTSKGQDAASSAMLMQNAFSALQKVDIQKGLKDVGVNIFDEQGKMRDIVSIFTDLNSVMSKLSQEKRTDLLDKVGLRDVQARNAFAILSSDVGKLQEAMSATGSPAGELNNALSNSLNNTQKFQIAMNKLKGGLLEIGIAFLPVVTTAANILGAVFSGLNKILSAVARNPIGKFILQLVGVAGLMITAFGLFFALIQVKEWLIGQLASGLLALGKTELATTFLTQGLTAGFAGLWAAIAPVLVALLPFIAIAAAIIGTVYLLKKSFDSFQEVLNGTAEPAKGFLGIMQKIGGVISAVSEIWKSATSDGFTLTEQMHDSLKKVGILDFVLDLATWIVRIKEFFRGVRDVLVTVFGTIWDVTKKVFSKIKEVVQPVLDSLGINLGKLGGSMETFRHIGMAVGIMIVAALIPPIVSLVLALLPIIATVLIVIGVMWLLWQAIKVVIAIVKAWVQFFVVGIGFVADIISSFVQFFVDIFSGKTFVEAGRNLVEGLKNGLLSAWEGLKSLFLGLIKTLPGGQYILDFLGVGSSSDTPKNPNGNVVTPTNSNKPSPLSMATAQTKLPFNQQGPQQNIYEKQEKEKLVSVNLLLDGKQLKTVMDKKDRENDSRK